MLVAHVLRCRSLVAERARCWDGTACMAARYVLSAARVAFVDKTVASTLPCVNARWFAADRLAAQKQPQHATARTGGVTTEQSAVPEGPFAEQATARRDEVVVEESTPTVVKPVSMLLHLPPVLASRCILVLTSHDADAILLPTGECEGCERRRRRHRGYVGSGLEDIWGYFWEVFGGHL